MDVMKIYNKSPIPMQNLACFIEGYRIKRNRFGDDFWRFLNEYENRNDWSYQRLCEFRDDRLKNIVKHCYETVPYYTELFNELGIDYKSIKTIEDLKVLPILTKETVKNNFQNFISTSIPKNEMIMSHTNGTTGSGFQFFTTKSSISEQWATWWRYRKNIGLSTDMRCAIFGGKPIVPRRQSKPPFWRFNIPLNQIYFSSYHLNNHSIKYYIDALNTYKLKWIHGFPSAIVLIASYMIENNIKLNYKLNFITTGSENLLTHQKDIIFQAFGIYPKEHYGLAEGVANISEHLDGNLYVDEDFSVVEFVDLGNEGKHIIGTNLTNFAMPLLRYDTKDIADVCTNNESTYYGRRVLAIDGRKEDYVTMKDGTKVGRIAHVFSDIISVKEAQIYQDKSGGIEVRIVKTSLYTKNDEEKIISNLKERLGSDIEISIIYVDYIQRTKSGKLRFVISEIK